MGSSDFNISNVVLADDDLDHGTLFQRILKQVDPGKSVTCIHDGEELLNYLKHSTPELLFLDLNMPFKDGYSCLEEIKNMPHLAKMKTVVYSSSSQMVDIHKSYMMSADLYMVKPFTVEHLKFALQSVLKLEWNNGNAAKSYFINNRFVPYTA